MATMGEVLLTMTLRKLELIVMGAEGEDNTQAWVPASVCSR